MRKTITIEIDVCEFCELEDCYGGCQEPYVEPNRVDLFTARDPITGVLMDYRLEIRDDSLTVTPCNGFGCRDKPQERWGEKIRYRVEPLKR
jgi:hypothetical protein